MTGQAVATYEERWAQDAQKAAAVEPLQSGTWLSAKGGQLSIGDEILPGAMAALIILDAVAENTYYGGKYVANDPLPPICYALGRDGEAMFPDIENMKKDMNFFMPQHVVQGQILGCDGCPLNEWGSAAEGKGKACQNRRRLAVIPAGYYAPKRGSRDFDLHLFDDPNHFKTAEIAFMKLPVTSVRNWAKYVHELASSHRRPPHGFITKLSVLPHQQYQQEVTFEPLELVDDRIAEIIINRHDTQKAVTLQGYQAPDPNRNQQQAPRSGSFRR